ncbi:MAG: type II/IV secretion system protein [Candidatus Coatesbacteria bacterium]|nr:type II/IV secretion system protein [Candidatus Coatesbacteria bacterium]
MQIDPLYRTIREEEVPNILFNLGILDRESLDKIKRQSQFTEDTFLQVILQSKVITEEKLMRGLAHYLNLPFVIIDPLDLDIEIITKTIPAQFAKKHKMITLDSDDKSIQIATANLWDRTPLDDLAFLTGKDVKVVICTETNLEQIIMHFYGLKSSVKAAEKQFTNNEIDLGNLEHYVHSKVTGHLEPTDQPIVKTVNQIMQMAFTQRASDIHIEPKRESILIRFRIDGVLHDIHVLPKIILNPIISRIKIMAGLDITLKREPQDGRFKTNHKENEVEIRVSTVPVAFGEKVVLRLLNPEIFVTNIRELGLNEEDLSSLESFLKYSYGIILVCGPTGAGKTTTLYSALQYLSSPEKNIVTVEDPIEFVYGDFNQIAVRPNIGITFASVIRTILRQDPDIIMIGEIRDTETAQSAIRAALTGHLVLSSIHTNTAVSSITRLLDMGVESYLLSSTIVGAISQRLVRTICPHCKQEYSPDGEERELLEFHQIKTDKLYKGKGCSLCRHTGFFGRIGIFEVLTPNLVFRKAIHAKATTEDLFKIAKDNNFRALFIDGKSKVLNGITTFQELLKVTTSLEAE